MNTHPQERRILIEEHIRSNIDAQFEILTLTAPETGIVSIACALADDYSLPSKRDGRCPPPGNLAPSGLGGFG